MPNNAEEVLIVCLNPTFQETIEIESYCENEVNRAKNNRLDASGKGMNVARVLRQLGVPATLFTHLGGPRVAEYESLGAEDGVPLLWRNSLSPIRTCITILDSTRKTTTELVGKSVAVSSVTDVAIRSLYLEVLPRFSYVVFSGTRAKGYSESLYSDMITEAKRLKKTVVLDIKGNDLKMALPCRPNIIKPNLSEFFATFFPEVVVMEHENSEGLKQQVQKKMMEIFREYGIKSIVTRGSQPAWAYDGRTFYEEPMVAVKSINTIGCGDAFTAGFVDSMIKGKPFGVCLHEAMSCGARKAACIRPGSLC